jgi:hypothetical protein
MTYVTTIWDTSARLVLPLLIWGQPILFQPQVNQPLRNAVQPVQLFERTGVVESKKIVESSGLTVSRRPDGALWTHNDSGQSATLFCVSLKGNTICELTITNADNDDWESMSSVTIEGIPHLLVADVGDNSGRRNSCRLYLLAEPEIDFRTKTVKISAIAKHIDFTYEDGPRNCETVAVDPLTNDVWLIEKIYLDSKQTKPPGIYRLALPSEFARDKTAKPKSSSAPESPQQKSVRSGSNPVDATHPVQVSQRIADFPIRNVTGADFSPDGKYLIIRNYLHAYLYSRDPEKTWQQTVLEKKPIPVPLPLQRQGEAICFSMDSQSLFVTSESTSQPIWKIDLPGYLQQLDTNQ